jgi:polysaccharide export outer membrane protein
MIKLVLALLAGVVPFAALAEQEYVLNPGDVLAVSVWKEEGLQGEVLVLPDGTISFPLAGQIAVAGHTLREVEQALAKRLDRYIPGPVVAVSVLNAAGNKVFVMGAVNKPGEYQIVQPMDVMQVLSLAGGLNSFASPDRIRILRRESGQQTVVPFEYSEGERGRNLETNIQVRSGDIIVVPEASLF